MTAVTAELTDTTTVRVGNGRHTWVGDEPHDAGGEDTGPTPYEQLLGSLAACTAITVSLYCRHKGWDLDGVTVEYHHGRVHADDCEDCDDDATGFLDHVQGRVVIDGDFDDAQRARLEQVARRCPVHKTLERGVVFGEEQVLVGRRPTGDGVVSDGSGPG